MAFTSKTYFHFFVFIGCVDIPKINAVRTDADENRTDKDSQDAKCLQVTADSDFKKCNYNNSDNLA